jgi:hypothetical protein
MCWKYYVPKFENGKMRTLQTTPGMGRRIKENDGGCEFN